MLTFRLKNRRPLDDDMSYEMFTDDNGSHCLLIHEVYQQHAAYYTCMAVNEAGSTITEAQLTVECK